MLRWRNYSHLSINTADSTGSDSVKIVFRSPLRFQGGFGCININPARLCPPHAGRPEMFPEDECGRLFRPNIPEGNSIVSFCSDTSDESFIRTLFC